MANNCLTYFDLLNYPFCCSFVDQLCCAESTIQLNLDYAVEFIEEITNTKWCSEEQCRTYDGSGNCRLFFENDKDKLQTITTVISTDCSTGVTTALTPVNKGSWLEFQCAEDTFPCGKDNIQVCGLYGEVIPEGVKRAMILLALEFSQPGITGIEAATNVEEIEWTDLKISYDNSVIDGSGFTTGYIQIDRMLAPYIPTASQIGFTIVSNTCCKDCCADGGCTC